MGGCRSRGLRGGPLGTAGVPVVELVTSGDADDGVVNRGLFERVPQERFGVGFPSVGDDRRDRRLVPEGNHSRVGCWSRRVCRGADLAEVRGEQSGGQENGGDGAIPERVDADRMQARDAHETYLLSIGGLTNRSAGREWDLTRGQDLGIPQVELHVKFETDLTPADSIYRWCEHEFYSTQHHSSAYSLTRQTRAVISQDTRLPPAACRMHCSWIRRPPQLEPSPPTC